MNKETLNIIQMKNFRNLIQKSTVFYFFKLKDIQKYSGTKLTIVGESETDLLFLFDNLVPYLMNIDNIGMKIGTKKLLNNTSQQKYKLLTIYLGTDFKTLEYLIDDIKYYLKNYGDKSHINLIGSSLLDSPIWAVKDTFNGKYQNADVRNNYTVKLEDNQLIFTEI